MVAAHICESCRGFDLSKLGLPGRSEPDHCYGRMDRPAPPGVLGGYRCSCDCRTWLAADNTREPRTPGRPGRPHKCPVCDGAGKVGRPPWVAGDQHSWTATDTGPYECRACTGAGVIWGPE